MRQNPLAYLDEDLNELRRQGLYRRLRVLDGEQAAHTSIDHRQVVNLSSNNYLGLTTHPTLRARALEALAGLRRRHGLGAHDRRARWRFTWSSSGGSPSSSTPRPPSSFRAASPRTPAPSRRSSAEDDVIVSDELNHASIIDGARLSRATIKVFPHRDVDAARADRARRCPRDQRKLLITDGVFSMDGDLGAAAGALRSGRRVTAAS